MTVRCGIPGISSSAMAYDIGIDLGLGICVSIAPLFLITLRHCTKNLLGSYLSVKWSTWTQEGKSNIARDASLRSSKKRNQSYEVPSKACPECGGDACT